MDQYCRYCYKPSVIFYILDSLFDNSRIVSWCDKHKEDIHGMSYRTKLEISKDEYLVIRTLRV